MHACGPWGISGVAFLSAGGFMLCRSDVYSYRDPLPLACTLNYSYRVNGNMATGLIGTWLSFGRRKLL